MSRLLLLSLALACAGAATPQQDDASRRRQVRALAESGKLDEAERAARAGGPALAVVLGQVLVLRGRLAEADALFTSAASGNLPGRRTADAELAELAFRRGDRIGALSRAERLARDYERNRDRWPAEDRVAAGRAYRLLGAEDADAVREALAAFDAALAADSTNLDARLHAGDLFLERYVAPDARREYEELLRRSPDHPGGLLGLARVLAFEGNSGAMAAARRALEKNPSLVPARLLVARFHLEAEAYDSAAVEAGRALAVDSTALQGWALLGATAWLRGDSAGFTMARDAARRVHPRPAEFYSEIGEAAARQRRYADAVAMGREAVALDSLSARALGVLGTNQLRTGDIAGGRAHLERAFERDKFHIPNKNTLDLLDQVRTFRTVDAGRFRIVAPPQEAELLSIYLAPLLEEAYDTLAARYRYRPPTPIRLELFRHHADFSVRTVGLVGLGALGVSFGTVLAMDAPSAREPGAFNWGSTAWHELAHTFTLGLSGHRVPRWLSEGLSVLEERRARPSWGADVSVQFLGAFKADRLRPVSRLNDGFVRPSHPGELGLSYYQASLVCEMIEAERGPGAFVDMLTAYRDGHDTPEVFKRVLGLSPEELDRKFEAWMRERFAVPLRSVAASGGREPAGGEFVTSLEAGRALLERGELDGARAALERAQQLFPDYTAADGPAWYLAQLHQRRGDLRAAMDQVARVTGGDETALAANRFEAELRTRLGDQAGRAAALERIIWIAPYDPAVHSGLAEAAERLGDHRRAVRERRALLALSPSDSLEARFQLARALALAGETASARREILQVLEQAPGFEKAQALLLELRRGSPEGGMR